MAFKPLYKLFLLLMISALVLSACGPDEAEATPTAVSAEAVFTAAAGTVVAQLTGTAAAQPTASTTPSPTVTGTATATLASIATNTQSAAVVVQPVTGGGAVGCNNSAFVSDVTVPDNQQIAPGTVFTKTWRLQNNGTCAWNTNYKLTFVSGESMGGATTVINQTVNAGSSADISVSLTAPSTPKTYVGYWKLSTDTGQAFGMSFYVQIVVAGTPSTPGTPGTGMPTITPTFGASGCFNSSLVSASPADGVTIKAGETFRKTWTLKNTGTCDWDEEFRFPYIGGTLMRADSTNKIHQLIKPGGTLAYFLDFTAPASPGTYTATYRLMTDTGISFGPSFTVKIVVAGATFTPTKSPTPVTPSVTPTLAPATVTPTATVAPATETPTPTQTVTPTETPTP